RPRPAVIALPGHDGPIERGAYWATGPYEWPGVEPYMHSYGRRLAEAGYVVLAIDVAGIGELGYLGYERLVNEGLLIGEPLKRIMLEQVHEAVDYLLARPEVDPRQVGVAGVSLGGELAMFAGLLDPRLAFVVSSGFLTSYRETGGTEMASLYIPGVLEVADIPDLAAMVAPKPMLIQAARNDSHFRIEDARRHVAKVRQAYGGAGAAGALSYQEHDRGHTLDVPAMLAWLARVAPVPGHAD
ncbi:MAG: dienelactone hydrolase family protein, partial [Candidatus Sericytochromatia bacterium]